MWSWEESLGSARVSVPRTVRALCCHPGTGSLLLVNISKMAFLKGCGEVVTVDPSWKVEETGQRNHHHR